jgi:hypothetical protein
VKLPATFANTTVILQDAIINKAAISFVINYLSAPADIVVILSDEQGTYGGNVTTSFSTSGASSVDITQVYKYLLSEYKRGFSLARKVRQLRGNILKVSLGIVTENVAVEVDPYSIRSTIEFGTQVTAAPSTSAPQQTSVSTKPVINGASSRSFIGCLFVLLALFIM